MKEKEVEKVYKKTVKKIEKILGTDGITNSKQLTNVGRELFGKLYRGTFPVDKLPKLKHNESCIVNLDSSGQAGSHWCSVFKYKDEYLVYDSFGRKTTEILPSLKHLKHRDSDYDPNQQITEHNCGQRSSSWLYCCYLLGPENAMKI